MDACGVIVEYNPFHNGHLYHIREAKKKSQATCIIAVMSGSFLQRGEPAIIDKYFRATSALKAGVDIVLELPYAYAVQNSDLFAYGAVKTLHALGVKSICFGSESGEILHFISSYHKLAENKTDFRRLLQQFLEEGRSFPQASKLAFQHLGLTDELDLGKPNNILGFSYVKTILDEQLKIEPLTIKRIQADYHEETVKKNIASATSIRRRLFQTNKIDKSLQQTMPKTTVKVLKDYYKKTNKWHQWEDYFPFLKYRISTMTPEQIANIHDVEEGLQHRLIATEKEAISFTHWMNLLKTKRYTWTRLQRIFTHLLTNTTKEDIQKSHEENIPYVRMLGFSKHGQQYLNQQKKHMSVPIVTNFHREQSFLLSLEERASKAYYSVLPPKIKKVMMDQEFNPPIFTK